MGNKKALIHIGGGYLQMPSLQWAREAGLHVVLTDMNPHCPGRALADRFEEVGGTDIDALLELAHNVNREYELAGAYCSNDFGLPAVAAMSEAFSLSGPTIEAVRNALEKSRAREIWERERLPIPRGEQITKIGELEDLAHRMGMPLIIKPPDSSGSRGVSSAWNKSDLKASFENARSLSEIVLVEELIEGFHIDVNGLFLENVFHPCGTLDRFFSSPPFHYPLWGCQPSSLSEEDEQLTYKLMEHGARVLGIDDGPVKGDVIFSDNGPVLLEIAPRFHGDVSTAFVTPSATGFNPVKTWFNYLSGGPTEMPSKSNADITVGWMAVFPDAPGKLISICGVEHARSISGVLNVVTLKTEGAVLGKTRDNTSVCGFIWAAGDASEDVRKILIEAKAHLEILTR